MKGLPEDRCQCPHWGYVFKGQLTFRSDQGEETFGPGDAFYLPAGHIPIVAAGTEYLQFSPSEELHEVSAHLVAKARQMQAAPSA
jgi:quercetin dioxygenase-like cupin family protein